MSSKGIDNFLSGFSETGTERETLSFSLDQVRAVHKLATAQLPERSLWIVKLVQAAVAAGASEIDIRLGRKKVEVSFDHQLNFTALEVYDLVVSGQLPQDPFWLHLVTGVRAIFHEEGTSFLLQTLGANGRDVVAMSAGESFHYSGESEASGTKSFTFVLSRPYRMLALKKSLHLPVSQLLRGTAAEHLEILTRCWPSPAPIRVDGRLIDTRYDSPLMHHGQQNSFQRRSSDKQRVFIPRVCVSLRYLDPKPGQPTLPTGPPPTDDRKVVESREKRVLLQKPVFLDGCFLEWEYTQSQAGGVLLSVMGKGRSSWIFCILDGVVVQRVPIVFYPTKMKVLGREFDVDPNSGECILYPVSFEDLDLTQFSVRDMERRRFAIMKEMVPFCFESSHTFMEFFSDFLYVPESRRKSEIALGLASLAVLPVSFSFGGVGVGAYLGAQLFYNGWIGGVPAFAFRQATKFGYKKFQKTVETYRLEDIEQPPIE